jgi:hypothetical protein
MMTDLLLTVSTSGRRGVAANLAVGDVGGDAPHLVAGEQLKMVAPTTHSQISWLGPAGPWRTETAMEQALSPPFKERATASQ